MARKTKKTEPEQDSNQVLYSFADPRSKPGFRSTFIRCASMFMSKEDIAIILQVSLAELETMCRKEFDGMSTSEAIAFMQKRSDLSTREILRKLMNNGNNTATNIYTTYVNKIQQADQQKALTIKVVGSIPDDDNDGGISYGSKGDGGISCLSNGDNDGKTN